ncbi:MAG: hypothetical protein K1060chlam2_00828 [Chlamydiae bacterium]|nr:hypothetical protein [Chlamydiota bacterium]
MTLYNIAKKIDGITNKTIVKIAYFVMKGGNSFTKPPKLETAIDNYRKFRQSKVSLAEAAVAFRKTGKSDDELKEVLANTDLDLKRVNKVAKRAANVLSGNKEIKKAISSEERITFRNVLLKAYPKIEKRAFSMIAKMEKKNGGAGSIH